MQEKYSLKRRKNMLRIHYNTVYTAPLKSFIRCIRFPFGNSFNGAKLGGTI